MCVGCLLFSVFHYVFYCFSFVHKKRNGSSCHVNFYISIENVNYYLVNTYIY